MKLKSLLYGKIESNKKTGEKRICFDDVTKLQEHLESLKEGTKVQILIEKYRESRSTDQNRYYWGCVIDLLCESFGWIDPTGTEEMHEYLKSIFLKKQRGELWTVRSTSSLTTKEFEQYMSDIRSWASLHGVYIPEPNEPIIQSIY